MIKTCFLSSGSGGGAHTCGCRNACVRASAGWGTGSEAAGCPQQAHLAARGQGEARGGQGRLRGQGPDAGRPGGRLPSSSCSRAARSDREAGSGPPAASSASAEARPRSCEVTWNRTVFR